MVAKQSQKYGAFMSDIEQARQKNERSATRFEGVAQRESRSKRFKGRPDVCFSIDYYDPQTGKRVRKTIGWRSEGFTAEMAASMRRDLLSVGKRKSVMHDMYVETPPLLFGEAWKIYKRDWIDGHVKHPGSDISNYNNHLGCFEEIHLHNISAHRIIAYMGELERTGLSPQTIKHVIGLMRRIMRKMVQWKLWRGELPFDAVIMPKINNGRTRYLTPVEAHALLAALKKTSPRMWIMSLISLHCGLRFGEIAALTFGDIDLNMQTIHVRESKSGKARHAVMSGAVQSALLEMQRGEACEMLFPSRTGCVMAAPSDAFERAVASLGFNKGITDRRQKVVFHSLRHTYASWLAMSGEGQNMIADLLGHSSLEMSRRYTHLMPDARKATAKAIDAIFSHE